MSIERTSSWAIYQLVDRNGRPGAKGMCEQRLWPEMERLGRGRCVLVRGWVPSEAEAERFARGEDPEPVRRRGR